MPDEELLPKPQTDLPVGRQEIPAQTGLAMKKLNLKWVVILLLLLGVGLIAIIGGKYYLDQKKLNSITDFESCAQAGYPVMESYPGRCITPDGRSFTQILSKEEQKKLLPPDETADWKTYKGETTYTSDGSSMFTIKYPPSWVLEKNRLHSSGKIPKEGEYIEGDIIFALGSGGRGTPPPQEQKEFPAGKFDYYWKDGMVFANLTKNNISYIFYVYGGFGEDEAKYKKIFDQMLSTFRFTQ